MAVKGPEAFRTISEVARELDVPQHVLRFWETRFTQVKPMKRGGGRRYYRPEDIALLKGIHRLLYSDGFTIRGVQKILRERGVQQVIGATQPGDVRDGAKAPAPANVVDFSARRVAPPANGGADEDHAPIAAGGAIHDALRGALDELTSLKGILDRARE